MSDGLPAVRRACIERASCRYFASYSSGGGGEQMQVRAGMSHMVLTVGPGHSLRAVSRLMAQREVGAAVVLDPDGAGPGIITERDVLQSIGAGQDPDVESVADHVTR